VIFSNLSGLFKLKNKLHIRIIRKVPKFGFKPRSFVKKQVSGKKSPALDIPNTKVGIKFFFTSKSTKKASSRLCLRGHASTHREGGASGLSLASARGLGKGFLGAYTIYETGRCCVESGLRREITRILVATNNDLRMKEVVG